MKILKTLSFVSLFSFSSLSACGYGGFYGTFAKDNYYNFLPTKLVNIDVENPLYSFSSGGSGAAYNERETYYSKLKRVLNVQEWHEYFHESLNEKELEELFYSNNSTLLQRYGNYAKKIKNAAFEKYLKLVDKQLNNVSGYGEKHTYSNKLLSQEAEEAFEKETDAFLKLRYLFLSMRLAHYGGDYKRSLSLYAEHYSKVASVKSVVVEWIDALRAGALQHLGKKLESNLLYAKVFKNNKSNAHLGYYDFKIKSDKEWKALLSKAKDNDEKALFYFLRALKWEGSPLHEHEILASIAPHSIWFERLTLMLMQEFQNDAFEYESTKKKNNIYVKEARKVYELKEKRFLKTMSSIKEPSFFDLYCEVYLNYLKTGTLEQKHFSQLSKMAKGNEKDFVELLSYLEKGVHVDKASQKSLFEAFSKLNNKVSPALQESLFNYTALHNISLYPESSAKRIYSVIFSDKSGENRWYISRDSIEATSFEAYVEEKNRNFYEEKLFKESMKILEKGDVAKTLALLYMKDANFEKAQHYLSQVPSLQRQTDYNPFNVSFSGNNRKVKGKGYTQKKFLDTMMNLEAALKVKPNSAMDHYLYANGLYNSSWFGNFPMVATIWRTTTSIEEERVPYIQKQLLHAKKEYVSALKNATKKEFKAKIAYQILKIELAENVFLKNPLYMPEFGSSWHDKTVKDYVLKSERLKEVYGEYEKAYQETKFGKEVIGSCATFSYFH